MDPEFAFSRSLERYVLRDKHHGNFNKAKLTRRGIDRRKY